VKKLKKEFLLEGIPISDGVGIGTFYLFKGKEREIPEFAITSTEVSYEIARYRRALSSSKEELETLYNHLQKEGSLEVSNIIDAHIQMLKDPIIAESIEEKIAHMRQNTESVFTYVMDDYKRMFRRRIKTEDVEERLLDIKDLSRRILRHLNPRESREIAHNSPNSIYADYEIIPTKVAEAKKGYIEGFISKIGGEMSHSAVIARAKGIPFVSAINLSLLDDIGRETVIVDGNKGVVILAPTSETIEKYKEKNKRHSKVYLSLEECPSKILTEDGVSVNVSANFDCMDDLEKVNLYKVNSVGLIRTEFLFFQEAVTTLSLQFQVDRYEQIIEGAPSALLTFRLFDIGSDKKIIDTDEIEPNPALGIRSIRFLMKYPKIFKIQVKALYQASLKGNIRILLPLITDYDELQIALCFIENARKEISYELDIDIPKVPVGCMVEVPSFAILADHFAKICDFFSIGTNDLLQYTLAMDRICPQDETIFKLHHPSILRLIKIVVDAANKEGIEVSICGEAASNIGYTKLLLGLGLRDFSCSMRHIPIIRKALSELKTTDAEILAIKAVGLSSAENVRMLLEQETCLIS
jgi:phosphotransferase system enzyme I (PtsI)